MTWPNTRPGTRSSDSRSFCEALWLPGWSDRSVWGYDEPTGSYFAQLWPDGDDADTPAIWVAGSPPVSTRRQIASLVAAAAGADVIEVLAVMVLKAP